MLRTVKNAIIYGSVRLALPLLGAVPLVALRRIARLLGAFIYLVARRERRCAARQLRECFVRITPNRVDAICRGLCNHLAMNAIELCRILRSANSGTPVHIPEASRRALETARSCGRGVLFITGHIGSWERMAIALAGTYPVFTVAKESYDPRFTSLIDRHRRRLRVNAIFRGRPGATAAMVRALRNNGILGFLIDQDTDVPGVFSPFFSRPAFTPSGPAAFAVRTGIPAVVGTLRRTPAGHHVLEMEIVDPAPDVQTLTDRFNRILEQRIRVAPSQWVWFHRRWKTRSDRATTGGRTSHR